MNRLTAALVSLASVGAAAAVGASYSPRKPAEAVWYGSLRKPPFTPPGPAIGITWGVLETLLCVTGYRLLTQAEGRPRTVALSCWSVTVSGLAGFQFVFFGRKALGAATAVATAMFASTAATAVSSARADPVSAVAMTPLVLWTAFAVLLSEEIWRRN